VIGPDLLPQAEIVVKIVGVDILLSADNAVVIALACRGLRLEDRRIGYVAGVLGAMALRLLFASGVVFMLEVPFLKIAGGLALLFIAVRLLIEETPADTQSVAAPTLPGAIVAILIGDTVMSLDNVVAVAALAEGSVLLLALGLALSIPLLIFGSALLSRLIDGYRVLVLLAGMLLGWVAGSIAASDPALAPWIMAQAPALEVSLPAGGAVLVLIQALILRRRFATVHSPGGP